MSIEPAVLPTDAPARAGASGSASPSSARFEAVDLLRGAVIVLMALDHTRDFFGDASLDPTDLSRVGPAMFLTRWVTHFCAPTFAFLAGVGAYLAGVRGRSRSELAAFLASRGLWLIFLELTVVNFALSFNPVPSRLILVVFWSIGGSFVLLAPLVFLPSRVVGALGVLAIATHQLIEPLLGGPLEYLAVLLFRRGPPIALPGGVDLIVGYPLIPWFGVVAAGYGFGEVIRLEPHLRRRVMGITGLGLTAAFVALRAWGGYGEPQAWSSRDTPLLTALEFLNCTKNPPSLLFLLMTLGPSIAFMAVLDRAGARGPVGQALLTFGRVPLFFFLLHLYVIHGLSMIAALVRNLVTGGTISFQPPAGGLLGLPGVYLTWLVMLVILYVPCRWFAGVKARHREGWLSYL